MADDDDSEMRFINVPERSTEDLVITVPSEERTENATRRWADAVQNEEHHMDHHCRFEYPAHMRSEIYSFDGILPPQRLGELPEADRARLYRLNGVPNRPCSARFRLADQSMDAKTILDRITSTGVMRNRVKCIQRVHAGQIEVTFATVEDHDLFLSKAAVAFGNPRSFAHLPSNSSAIYVTVHNVPWELPDTLLMSRLRKYGLVYGCRRAFNQSLLPEKVHDGRRVLRMSLHQDIPSFLKFGPYLLRVFYVQQPKVCWKCSSHQHIGRNCPDDYCFNCDQSGHVAATCPEFIKCSLCKSEYHLAVDCDGNWGRRTLAQRTPARTEPPGRDMEAENTDQNANEAAGEPEGMESEEVSDVSKESAAETDDETENSQDEIQSFSTEDPAEVGESIDDFSSPEPPPKQRKRDSVVKSSEQKRPKTDENPP